MMKGSTFNVDENACIQTLLNLISHGNAIIAEILRLKDNIPPVFSLETKENQTKYGDILFDFSYFKNSDALEKKISTNPTLQELDDEFKENNLSIITRFYLAFENIYQYVADLNLFLEQLNEGVFIQQNLDTVLQDSEGKQLLCEGLYLYGVMLLVCETYVSGKTRERLLVAWHRTTASNLQTNLDKVCELLSDTEYRNVPGSRRPQHYPETLFRRVRIDESFVEIIVNRLRSEDIYNQISFYPLPEHRSTALASQSAMLVVCLFFSPNILSSENAKMREIVDKYFPDNWIVSIYMGITMNLLETWEPYKAAKSALANTINTKNIKDFSQIHSVQMKKLIPQTAKLIQEGVLKEEKLTDIMSKILCLVRECNVTLRWLMLHTSPTVIHYDNTKKSKQIRDQTISELAYQPMQLFQLLINTSLLELSVKDMLRTLLNNKEMKWEKQKNEAKARVTELSEIFSGEKPLARVVKIEQLQKWFNDIGKQIDSLNYDDMASSSTKIIQLIQGLEYVQEFHQLDDIMQVKQWLMEARNELRNMIRGGGLTEDNLVTLQVCADLSYGWCIAKSFTDLGRDALKKDPTLVSHLRAVFLKLASALEIPLLRINQAASPDLLSVSQYYSNELVAYVREVLQIIPETVFSLLERIIELQTSVIKELPSRVDKEQLKEYAQLENRMEVARLTHSVSVFTSGILKMHSTLVGVICIDPKQLLEDGIRCEVSRLVNDRLTAALTGPNGGDLVPRLQQLAKHMDGYRRSFEYIQDYINIHGLKIWQEEVTKIINSNVEEECSRLYRLKASQLSSQMPQKKNMFGCLVQNIYNLADPKTTIYIEHNSAWFDCKSHQETLSTSDIASVQKGVGVAGLHGVFRALGYRVASRLRHLTQMLPTVNALSPKPSLPPPNSPVPNAGKFYGGVTGKCIKVMPQVLDWLMEIGTAQLLMKHVAYRLNTSCKFDSHHLEASLSAMNQAVLHDVQENYTNPPKPYPHKEFLFELNELLERVGISQPFMNVYIKTCNTHIGYLAFLITISHLKRFAYYDNLGCLTSRRSNDLLDGAPFVVGIVTLLRQHHSDCIQQFVILLSQYIISYAEAGINLKTPEFYTETTVGLRFLELFCRLTDIPQTFVEAVIPPTILTQHQFMASKTI